MKKVSNSQCHYEITEDEVSFSYNFTTQNQISYKIAFIDGTDKYSLTNDIKSVYFITIEKESKNKEPKDYRVQLTIEYILKRFFKNKENSLLYICDANDNRQKTRHLTFNRWYKSSDMKEVIIKLDDEIPTTESSLEYVTLLYHIDNPFKESLEANHKEIIYSLKEGK